MALVTITVESQYLKGNTNVSVYLPDRPRDMGAADFYGSGKKYKTIYFLHGTHGDHTDWVRKSMLEVYARERETICVMPSGLNADYTDWPRFCMGFDMFGYLVKELIPAIRSWFPSSERAEDTFIAGLSMGGGGALKYILNTEGVFGAACIMSAAPRNWDAVSAEEAEELCRNDLRLRNQIANAGGFEAYRESRENSWRRVIELHEEGKLPKLYFTMGEQDFLYDRYEAFRKMCEEKVIPIRFESLPGYGHEWRFWDGAIERAMDFFGIEKNANADAWRGLKDPDRKNFFTRK